jgi:hypothetical protein
MLIASNSVVWTAGTVTIDAGELVLRDGGKIITGGTGLPLDARIVKVRAGRLLISDDAAITSLGHPGLNTSGVEIGADTVELRNGGSINGGVEIFFNSPPISSPDYARQIILRHRDTALSRG